MGDEVFVQRARTEIKILTAKDAEDAKEQKSLTAKAAKGAKEKKSLTAKDAKRTIIKINPKDAKTTPSGV